MKQLNEIQWWHRIQLSDGSFTPGQVLHGPDGGDWPHTRFGLPSSLVGKSVLDIGCWDGFFSFKAEKLGADVVLACDVGQHNRGTDGFEFAKDNLKSKVNFYPYDVQTNTLKTAAREVTRQFDIVLMYGVLYHLKEPLKALQNVSDMTKDYALIETAISNIPNERSVYEFKPNHQGDPTNFWYPNLKGLEDSLKYVGFKSVEVIYDGGSRVTVKATK